MRIFPFVMQDVSSLLAQRLDEYISLILPCVLSRGRAYES